MSAELVPTVDLAKRSISKADPLIKEQEGIAFVKDVLYILLKICQLTKTQISDSKSIDVESIENDVVAENNGLTEVGNIFAENIEDNVLAIDNELFEGGAEAFESSTNNNDNDDISSTGEDIEEETSTLTMPEAMILLEDSLIYIPIILKNILEHDVSLQKSFNELCYALYEGFPNLVDYAQPAEFWSYYRKSKALTNKSPTKSMQPKKFKKLNYSSDENKSEDGLEVFDNLNSYQ